MDFYENSINGQLYLYAHDSIKVHKGKTITKTKCLGKLKDKGRHVVSKLDFLQDLIEQESKLRINHWQTKIDSDNDLKFVNFKRIEELRAIYYKLSGYLGANIQDFLKAKYLSDFIYNSNKIEGSKLSRKQVEQLVLQGLEADNPEVKNSLMALEYLNNKFRYNPSSLKKLHAILLAHEPHKHGLRKDSVLVGRNHEYGHENIITKLESLFDWLKKNENKTYPPKLAFEFYYKFERIHPFPDGNGRVGRLLLNKILRKHHYPSLIIYEENSQAHMSAFDSHIKGRPAKYFKFMFDQLQKTYINYLNEICLQFPLFKNLIPSDYKYGRPTPEDEEVVLSQLKHYEATG